MGRARKPLKHADPQPVATHGNRFAAHGKEGVDCARYGHRGQVLVKFRRRNVATNGEGPRCELRITKPNGEEWRRLEMGFW
jgi:hypothetical protein